MSESSVLAPWESRERDLFCGSGIPRRSWSFDILSIGALIIQYSYVAYADNRIYPTTSLS